jgi:hypothetical protein
MVLRSVKQTNYLWCYFLRNRDDDGELSNKKDKGIDEDSNDGDDVEDIEYGEVADSPVAPMEPSAA